MINSAFKERIISYKLTVPGIHINVQDFCNQLFPNIKKVLDMELNKHQCLKINMELFGLYYNPTTDVHTIKSFNTPYRIFCYGSEVFIECSEMFEIMDRKADELVERDSGIYELYFI